MSTDTFQRGQTVRLTCGETTLDARVVLVSANGVSMALTFDGMIAGHAGRMAVLWFGSGYRSVIGDHPVSVEAV
ncbi:MAG: hypothetical protein ABSC06_22440 [Rhodopila sp.]|jgi:hypothetical protein